MSKLNLELTPEEMMALGYAIGSGIADADKEADKRMKKALSSLFMKIHEENKRQEKEP